MIVFKLYKGPQRLVITSIFVGTYKRQLHCNEKTKVGSNNLQLHSNRMKILRVIFKRMFPSREKQAPHFKWIKNVSPI